MLGEENHSMCTDMQSSQDFVSGIMKIVPSDVNVSLILIIGVYTEWSSKSGLVFFFPFF